MLTKGLEGYRQPLAHRAPYRVRHADAARLGQGLNAGRHIDPVAIHRVTLVEHVRQLDAHAELEPPVRRQTGIT